MPDATSSTANSSSTSPGGQRPRREFRNLNLNDLSSYRLPPAGIVSILHRVSGALLFVVGIPVLLFLFQNSLRSEIGFDRYHAIVSSIPVRLVLLVLIWALVHHLIAGIRFLLLDVHVGVEKPKSAQSAKIVLGLSVAITVLIALAMFVF